MPKIVELNAQKPTVDSILTRLHRDIDKIESVTVVIDWKNGGTQVCYNGNKVDTLSFHLAVLQEEIIYLISEGRKSED